MSGASVTAALGDNVKRWQEEVLPKYPEARYAFDPPYFTGALRDADDAMRRVNLGVLIDALLAREGNR